MSRINRFDTAQPARDNMFNTFVPLPLDQLTALGMSRKQDLEKNQNLIDKAYNDVLNIQAIPGSHDESIVKGSILPAMTDIATKYSTVDLSNPTELANMRRELRTRIDPTLVNMIEQNHQSWLQSQSAVRDLKQRGLYNDKLSTDPAIGWDSATMGAYQYSPEAYQGRDKLMEPYFQHLKPSFKGVDNGRMVISVDQADIDRVANERANELVDTPSGQQEIRLFKQQYPGPAKQMGSDEAIMRRLMQDYGEQYKQDVGDYLNESQYSMWRAGQTTPNGDGAHPLTNTQGVTGGGQFKTVNKLNNTLSTLLSSQDPYDVAQGTNLKYAIEKATKASAQNNVPRQELMDKMRTELLSSGKFKDPKQLDAYMNLVSNYTRSAWDVGGLGKPFDRAKLIGEQNFTVDENKQIEALNNRLDADKTGTFIKRLLLSPGSVAYREFTNILNIPAVATALYEKGTDRYGEYKNVSLKDLIQKNESSFGSESIGITNKLKDIPSVSKSLTNPTSVSNITNKYVGAIQKTDVNALSETNKAILQQASTSISPKVSFNIPYSVSKKYSLAIDQATGKRLGESDIIPLTDQILSNFDDYEIISVNNNSGPTTTKTKTALLQQLNSGDLENTQVTMLPERKYNFNPVVELDFNSKQGGKNIRNSVRLVVRDQTQKDSWANTLASNGDLQTATAIRQPQIVSLLSAETFEEPTTFYLQNKLKGEQSTLVIVRNPKEKSEFLLSTPNDPTKQPEVFPDVQSLASKIAYLAGKNNMFFNNIPLK
jgi:hypothetical protein